METDSHPFASNIEFVELPQSINKGPNTVLVPLFHKNKVLGSSLIRRALLSLQIILEIPSISNQSITSEEILLTF